MSRLYSRDPRGGACLGEQTLQHRHKRWGLFEWTYFTAQAQAMGLIWMNRLYSTGPRGGACLGEQTLQHRHKKWVLFGWTDFLAQSKGCLDKQTLQHRYKSGACLDEQTLQHRCKRWGLFGWTDFTLHAWVSKCAIIFMRDTPLKITLEIHFLLHYITD